MVRTKDALTSPLNWRRRHFAALVGAYRRESYRPPSRLASVVVPDLSLLTWLPFALPTALRLSRARHFDCVLTTSPPPSAHLWAWRSGGEAPVDRGAPRRLDLEPPHAPWPLRLSASSTATERRVLIQADAVIGVTSPIVEDVRARLGLDAALITNGYDPEDVPPDRPGAIRCSTRSHSLVHTGRLSRRRWSIVPLLEGMRIGAPRIRTSPRGSSSFSQAPRPRTSDGCSRFRPRGGALRRLVGAASRSCPSASGRHAPGRHRSGASAAWRPASSSSTSPRGGRSSCSAKRLKRRAKLPRRIRASPPRFRIRARSPAASGESSGSLRFP